MAARRVEPPHHARELELDRVSLCLGGLHANVRAVAAVEALLNGSSKLTSPAGARGRSFS
jgi:hypothetical protein